MGLEGVVRIDHRAFPLELVNDEPTNKAVIDGERAALADVEPHAGWSAWSAPVSTWPVTTLPALEAVQAAKEQGLAASEQLDRALRVAFFAESRCISLRPVILEVARECDRVDDDALAAAFDDGRGRAAVIEQWRRAEGSEVAWQPARVPVRRHRAAQPRPHDRARAPPHGHRHRQRARRLPRHPPARLRRCHHHLTAEGLESLERVRQ